MAGSYVSENGVRFDSKHSSILDTSSKCRRMQDRVGAQWQKRLKNSKEKWRALQTGKKEDGASRDLGEAEHKTGEVKETSKDVVTQLTEENGDLRKTIDLTWETSSNGDI